MSRRNRKESTGNPNKEYDHLRFKNVTQTLKVKETSPKSAYSLKRTPEQKRHDLISFVHGQVPRELGLTKADVVRILEEQASVHLPAGKKQQD